jgi:hypothetical protein
VLGHKSRCAFNTYTYLALNEVRGNDLTTALSFIDGCRAEGGCGNAPWNGQSHDAHQETYNVLGALDYLKVPDRLAAFDSQTFSRQPRSATIKS